MRPWRVVASQIKRHVTCSSAKHRLSSAKCDSCRSSWHVGLVTLIGVLCRVGTVKLEPCQQSGMLRTLNVNILNVLDVSMTTAATASEGCVNILWTMCL